MSSPEVLIEDRDHLLDQVEIRFVEADKYYAHVPIGLINGDEVPVDEAHVDELAKLMRKHEQLSSQEAKNQGDRNGQQSDITVAYIEGSDRLYIIDGFHRVSALEKNGAETGKCIILMDKTMEDVLDLRISAAASHQSVKLPRILEWITEAWGMTPWSDTLTASQAFDLVHHKRSGAELGIFPDQLKDLREAVEEKAGKWGMAVGTLSSHLRMADKIDPELVKQIRDKPGGGEQTSVSSGHLKKLSKVMPRKYKHQNIVVEYAIANNLNIEQTEAAAKAIADIEDLDEARKLINDPAWKAENLTQKSGRKPKAVAKPKPRKRTKTLSPDELPNIVVDEIDIASLALENTVLKGEYTPLPSGRVKRTYIELDDPGVNDLVKRYDWDDTKIKSTHLALLKDKKVGINHLTGKDGFFEDKAKLIVDIAVKRIMKDINDGALQYTGVPNIPALFARTLHDQTLREKNNIMPVPPLRGVNAVALDLGQYTEAMEELKDKYERRVITLSAVFNLNSFAISQVLKIEETEINQQIAKLARELS